MDYQQQHQNSSSLYGTGNCPTNVVSNDSSLTGSHHQSLLERDDYVASSMGNPTISPVKPASYYPSGPSHYNYGEKIFTPFVQIISSDKQSVSQWRNLIRHQICFQLSIL